MSVMCRLLLGLLIFAPAIVVAEDASLPATEEAVPPPPSGPYMSTALSDNENFVGGQNKRSPLADAAASPFFSPDMPWPGKPEMTQQWLPEEGYTFAPAMPPARLPAAKPRRLQRQMHSQMQRHTPGTRGNLMAPMQRYPQHRPDMMRPPVQSGPAANVRPPRQRTPANRASPFRPSAGRGMNRSPSMHGQRMKRPQMNTAPQPRPQMQRPAMNRSPMQQRPPSYRPRMQRPPLNTAPPRRGGNMPPPGPWLPLGNYPAR